ncbi:hypothetical protein ElyMa_005109800 [Elysia marginata]|uniref:Uncharacterized protein n=1 Tax=Elysia marginata TaxID=1093978 RepID=A0AAV4JPG9_9GAST|nr:hypothetical protein ElyMa_005109800 [Elysia marginata]
MASGVSAFIISTRYSVGVICSHGNSSHCGSGAGAVGGGGAPAGGIVGGGGGGGGVFWRWQTSSLGYYVVCCNSPPSWDCMDQLENGGFGKLFGLLPSCNHRERHNHELRSRVKL